MELKIETTADGSATLYRPDIDEHYHSVKGAATESRHVYLAEGFDAVAEGLQRPVRVLEIGFGTGLNAALTVARRVPTEYYSLELYPLPASALVNDDVEWLREVNQAPWGDAAKVADWFTLYKIEADFLTVKLPQDIDVVYFDAFAPEKQPEMWSEANFRRLFDAMAPGGVLTTYCAKGVVRRTLQGVGFEVERRPGPVGGKREILRARKPTQILP